MKLHPSRRRSGGRRLNVFHALMMCWALISPVTDEKRQLVKRYPEKPMERRIVNAFQTASRGFAFKEKNTFKKEAEIMTRLGMFRNLLSIAALAAVVMFVGFTQASADVRHEFPYVFFDDKSKVMVGDDVAKDIKQFFYDAEKAIRDKNLDALMSLYSNSYSNGPHDKESIERVWKYVFDRFDKLYTKHNMRFLTSSSPEGSAMIIRCSGILMGTPKGEAEAYSIALDHWINNDHVLAKEADGKWRIVGTAGKEQRRFGFDKPIHPLF